MIQALLVLVLILAAACAVSVLVAKAQAKRADRAEKDRDSLHEAVWDLTETVKRLRKAQENSLAIEEKAHEERENLAATADSGLANRASNLFGMRDGTKRP